MGVQQPAITEQQLELLKSFRYLTTETEIREVKELLNLYFRRKLEAAVDRVEEERGYTAEVYEEWLRTRKD